MTDHRQSTGTRRRAHRRPVRRLRRPPGAPRRRTRPVHPGAVAQQVLRHAQGRRPDLLRRPRLRALLRDAPRHASRPTASSPCSDPDLAFKQLIMEAGVGHRILEPAAYPARHPRGAARDVGRTQRLAGQPLAGQPQQLARALARLDLPGHRGPGGQRREIETLGRAPVHGADPDQGRAAAVLGQPQVRPDLGRGHQARHPVSCHLSRSHYDELPMPPVGLPSYNHDFMVTYSLLAANQVMSLIFDGTFDRHPTLQDRLRRARVHLDPAADVADGRHLRGPQVVDGHQAQASEYVKDHIKFTTQPLDYPEDKTELTRAFEWMECEKILLFSSATTRTGRSTTRAGWSSTCPSMPAKPSCSATASRPTPAGDRAGPRGPGPGLLRADGRRDKTPRLAQGREHVVATVDEIPPGTHKLVPIGRHGVGVYNVNGTFYAIANYCPHEGGPLCSGRARGRNIVDDERAR